MKKSIILFYLFIYLFTFFSHFFLFIYFFHLPSPPSLTPTYYLSLSPFFFFTINKK